MRGETFYYSIYGFEFELKDIEYLRKVSEMINKYEDNKKIVINTIYKTLDSNIYEDYTYLTFKSYVNEYKYEQNLYSIQNILQEKFNY